MRVRLYNKEFPEGKVFTGEEEYNQALAEGVWYENFWMPSGVVPDDLKESWGDRPIEPLRLPEIEKPIYKEDISNNTSDPGEEVKYCECGCGQVVKGRFVKGHYYKWWKQQRNGVGNGDDSYNQPADPGGSK
jgi:hypothetical protein